MSGLQGHMVPLFLGIRGTFFTVLHSEGTTILPVAEGSLFHTFSAICCSGSFYINILTGVKCYLICGILICICGKLLSEEFERNETE